MGKDLLIAADHKPLLKIFGDRSPEAISNNRLRNLKEKTLRIGEDERMRAITWDRDQEAMSSDPVMSP